MTKRKTDSEFRAEVKALVGDEYLVLGHYKGYKPNMLKNFYGVDGKDDN